MERRVVRLMVHGRVQGVGYRTWVMETGRSLELDGWARNRSDDGSVEILAAGPDEVVERLIHACRVGPVAAWVTSMDMLDAIEDGTAGFHIRHTL